MAKTNLGFLGLNLHPQDKNEAASKAKGLVRPVLEYGVLFGGGYGCPVWDPHGVVP